MDNGSGTDGKDLVAGKDSRFSWSMEMGGNGHRTWPSPYANSTGIVHHTSQNNKKSKIKMYTGTTPGRQTRRPKKGGGLREKL